MEPEKAERILKIAEKLDNMAREVSFRAVRYAAGIPISRTQLANYFIELSDTAMELARELGLGQ